MTELLLITFLAGLMLGGTAVNVYYRRRIRRILGSWMQDNEELRCAKQHIETLTAALEEYHEDTIPEGSAPIELKSLARRRGRITEEFDV